MRVLVTGANGAMGSVLRARLTTTPGVSAHYLVGRERVERGDRQLDIADSVALSAAINDVAPQVIVHLAGITGAACDVDLDRTRAVNVDAVASIMRTVPQAGVSRVVFLSSSSVYGDSYASPVGESAEPQPRSHYARSKLAAEHEIASALTDGTDAIALRVFNVYGPGFERSLVNRLLGSSEQSPVTLDGLDQFVRDYVHVNDVVSAIMASLTAAVPARFTPMNVGSGVPTSNRRLVDVLSTQHDVHWRLGEPVRSYSCARVDLCREVLQVSPADFVP